MAAPRIGAPPAAPHGLPEEHDLREEAYSGTLFEEQHEVLPPGERARDEFDRPRDAGAYYTFQTDQASRVTPAPDPAVAIGSKRGWYSVTFNHLDSTGTRTLTPNLGFDRQGVGASLDRADGQRDLAIGTWDSPGYCELDLNWMRNLPGSLAPVLGIGVYGAGWKDFAGIGGAATLGLLGRYTIGAGGFLGISAERSLRYLGPYLGPNERLRGRHRVEIVDTLGGSASLHTGAALHGYGLTGRLSVYRNRDVRLWTWMDEGETGLRLRRGAHSGVVPLLLRAARLRAERDPLPDLSKPLDQPGALQPGQRLSLTVQGEWTGGVIGGVFPLRGGAMLTSVGRFGVTVERQLKEHEADPATRIEVTIAPDTIEQGGLFATFFETLGANRTWSGKEGRQLRFRLDLAEESARRFYEELRAGKLPALPSGPAITDPRALRAAIAAADLGPGIQLDYLEQSEARTKTDFLGTMILAPWRPREPYLEIGTPNARGRESLLTADRSAAHRRDVGVSVEGAGLRGRRVPAETSAAARFSYPEKSSAKLENVEFTARLTLEDHEGDRAQRELIGPLEALFHVGLGNDTAPGPGGSLEVVLEQVFRPNELERLSPSRRSDLARAADRSGISFERLVTLTKAFRAPAGQGAARAARRFIEKEGLAGFAALRALSEGMTDPPRLVVKVARGTERELPIAVAALAQEYLRPVAEAGAGPRLALDPDGPAAAVQRFYLRATALAGDLDRALAHLETDPFFALQADPASARGAARAPLAAAARELHRLLDLKAQGFDERARARLLGKVDPSQVSDLVERAILLLERVQLGVFGVTSAGPLGQIWEREEHQRLARELPLRSLAAPRRAMVEAILRQLAE